MLPSHGRCIAIFLLSRVAALKRRSNVEEWVSAARSSSSILAASLDLRGPAELLLSTNLARYSGSIEICTDLAKLCDVADRATLSGIARLLLLKLPPTWLRVAAGTFSIDYDYVPADDLRELNWLAEDLTHILLDVYQNTEAFRDDQIRTWLGNTAELMVMAALRLAGRNPVHVSRISDTFGYDIECQCPRERIEVKAASEHTKTGFHISRNEFEKAKLYGQQWKLLQLIFRSDAFVTPFVGALQVAELLELSSADLIQLIPPDTPSFRWSDSAHVTVPSTAWRPSQIILDLEFSSPGLSAHKSLQ